VIENVLNAFGMKLKAKEVDVEYISQSEDDIDEAHYFDWLDKEEIESGEGEEGDMTKRF